MDFETITYVLLAYLTAAFLKGVAGLGFSTICLGILAGFIDLRLAIPLVILPSVASNLLVMIEAGNFTQILRRHRLLYACLLPGLATGLWFLVTWNPAILTRLLGTILVLYGIWSLANPRFTMSPALASGLKIPTGFLTGLINGLTGAQVMPVVPYMLSAGMTKQAFVQAVNISFTLSSIVMIIGLGASGLLDRETALISVAGIIPVVATAWLGTRIRQRLSEDQFHSIVVVILMLLGLNLLWGA